MSDLIDAKILHPSSEPQDKPRDPLSLIPEFGGRYSTQLSV
ncbi:hypothetical protein [Nitrosomonas sp.]|nr:hypothetical protein [Nitrosomonas sp.]